MNQTAVLPERTRGPNDLLRDVLEMLVPILLTLVIVALILFRADVLHRFKVEASHTRTVACDTVKQSNDDLDTFLAKQAAAARSPEFSRFVADLAAAHGDTYRKCVAAG